MVGTWWVHGERSSSIEGVGTWRNKFHNIEEVGTWREKFHNIEEVGTWREKFHNIEEVGTWWVHGGYMEREVS